MKNQFSLEIDKPCSENFNQFTPTSNGGFCGSCQKEVIDFSKMNPEEIMNYFKNRSDEDTCGKFNADQLKTYSEDNRLSKKYRFWSGLGLACLSLFSFNSMQAQTETVKENPQKTISNQQEKSITVKPGGNFSVECAIHPNMLLEVIMK